MLKIFVVHLVALNLLFIICNCVAQQKLSNPIIDRDFADPSVIRFGDKYYAYATNSKLNDTLLHIQLAVSDDMRTWECHRDALPAGALWAKSSYWAPHVVYDDVLKLFVMYYSAQSNIDTLDKCIGVAFSKNPEGPFIDKGSPLISGKGFVNIDPFAFIDQKSGKKLLYWGSGHKPIKVQELNDDWSGFKPGTSPKPVLFPRKDEPYAGLVEGAWIDFNNGYYYLYYSGDNCCGTYPNYAVMVARSKTALGPFERLGDINGTHNSVILQKKGKWLAPGHNAIFRDKKGYAYIAYHAINKESKNLKSRLLLISKIVYKNGWPVVSY